MLVNRLISALVLSSSVLGSDGFYKLDFDVRKGTNLTQVVHDFVENVHDAIDDLGDTLDNTLSGLFDSSKKREGGSQQVPLSNERVFYISSLQIGTPASEVRVLLDTGSSDLWVMSSNNSYCSSNGGSMNCETYGTFDEGNSTTFTRNDTSFSIQYLDQTYAKGTWGQDTVELTSSLILKNGNLAVAEETDSNVGVFGIGYKSLESTTDQYDNLPIQMKQQGFIYKNCYSLYLTSAESEKGSILFGGVDHAKYSGELVEFDISPENGEIKYLQIPLTSLTVNVSNVESASASSSSTPTTLSTATSSPSPHPTIAAVDDTVNEITGKQSRNVIELSKRSGNDTIDINVNALFDSGTTLTYLPNDAAQQLLDAIAPGATYDSSIGGYKVPCTLRQPGNSVTYDFSGKQSIEVPMSDLVMTAGKDSSNQVVCMLGVVGSDRPILGDNFLRSCYTLFNLDDNTISIAQMNYSDDENIEVIH